MVDHAWHMHVHRVMELTRPSNYDFQFKALMIWIAV